MSVDLDRHARLYEVLADGDRSDLAESLLWPALAALSLGETHAGTRRCAQAFVRLTADVLALEEPSRDEVATWRRAVFSLALACQEVDALVAEVEESANPQFSAVLRQMLRVTEEVALLLESTEPQSSTVAADGEPVLPPREIVAASRRRPWFGRDVSGDELWPDGSRAF